MHLFPLKVHHKVNSDNAFTSKPGSEVLYHCPVKSCVYHESLGKNGKHFPKLKYLKQVSYPFSDCLIDYENGGVSFFGF